MLSRDHNFAEHATSEPKPCPCPPLIRSVEHSCRAGATRELDVWHHAVNFPVGIRVDGAWHMQNVKPAQSMALECVERQHGL